MDQLKLFSTILFSTLLFACSGHSSAPGDKNDAPGAGTGNTGDSTYSGTGSFTYTIGGRHVAIKDIMHDGDGKNRMALFLNEVKNNTSAGTVKVNITNELSSEVFDFTIANTGSSVILHYSPSLSNFVNKSGRKGSYMSPKFKNYYADSVIVNITGINANHVAGTFSGKFLSDDDKPLSLDITDGSFDVPFTKDNDQAGQ